MDFWYRVCCCFHREEELEKNPLIPGDILQYFNKLQKRQRSEAINLWNEPLDSTHVERDDDHELYVLLQKRSKTRRGSEDYRRLSYDITAHRQIRRKMKDRWKLILEVLGFKDEADGLLTVTSSTTYESLRNPQEARRLHSALAGQTAIFGHHRGGPPERYLFVLDRLLLLDVGDDFLLAARHFYPVDEEDDNGSSSDGGPPTPGPILVTLNSEAQEEAETVMPHAAHPASPSSSSEEGACGAEEGHEPQPEPCTTEVCSLVEHTSSSDDESSPERPPPHLLRQEKETQRRAIRRAQLKRGRTDDSPT